MPWRAQGNEEVGGGVGGQDRNRDRGGHVQQVHDVAVTFPPGRGPLVVAAYYEAPGYFENMRSEDEAVLAAVGALVAERFGGLPER